MQSELNVLNKVTGKYFPVHGDPLTGAILFDSISAGYHTNDVDEASATITYVGSTNSAGAWQIQKIDTTSGTSIRYANGTSNYTTNWTNRTSLTYIL